MEGDLQNYECTGFVERCQNRVIYSSLEPKPGLYTPLYTTL